MELASPVWSGTTQVSVCVASFPGSGGFPRRGELCCLGPRFTLQKHLFGGQSWFGVYCFSSPDLEHFSN